LQHDAAIGGAESFAQSDFARALGDRDQHDVDHADGAESASVTRPTVPRNSFMASKMVPIICACWTVSHAFEGVFIVIIEVVIAGDDAASLILREQVFVGDAGLIVEERNRVVGLLALEREIAAHDLEGNVAAGVGGVVVAAADAESECRSLRSDGR
jgi:hypothetical protein